MRSLVSFFGAIVAIVTLSSCSFGPITTPDDGVMNCSKFMRDITLQNYLIRHDVDKIAERGLLVQFFQAPVSSLKDRKPAEDGKIELNILVLSGGGQWGAYGAGFLNGWSEYERIALKNFPPWMKRGDVDFITGISTGAMQSSLAFAGIDPKYRQAADDNLRINYTPENKDDIIKKRSLLMTLLTGGNGTFDPTPLEQTVDEMVTEFGPVIRNKIADNKQMVVGLANARTGRLHLADMRAALKADREDCYKEFLLGSSAVPGTFPPRFIDRDMYVDGGIRLGLFLPLFWENLAYEAVANDIKPQSIRVKILTIVNGTLSANDSYDCEEFPSMCPDKPKNKLIPIIGRSVGILVDSVYNFSALAVREKAKQYDFEVEFRMAHASLGVVKTEGCKKDGSFNPVFMKCLYKVGLDDGKNQNLNDPFETPKP